MYVILMMTVITVLVLIGADLGAQSMRYSKTMEERLVGKLLFDAAVEQVSADIDRGALSLPGTSSYTIDGQTVSVTATDHPSVTQAATISVSLVIDGRTYEYQKVISKKPLPHPFFFAIYSRSSMVSINRFQTGQLGENGDVFVSGNLIATNLANDFQGDVEATGLITVTGSISGSTTAGATDISFANPGTANYESNRHVWRADGSTINGWAFVDVAGKPQLIFVDGDLTLKGTFSGQGVIYCKKDVTITDDISYANADSKLIVIADKNITVNATARNLVGFFYARRDFRWNGFGPNVLSSGSIVGDSVTTLANTKVINDPFFFKDTSRLARFYCPGRWP